MTFPKKIADDPTWGGRFDYILPKEDIRKRLLSLQQDDTTPWSFERMSQEMHNLSIYTLIGSVKGRCKMSDRTQVILSKFIQAIDSGRLKLYYANPDARRYKWGTAHPELNRPDPELPRDGPEWIAYKERMRVAWVARKAVNRVVREVNSVSQPKVVKQLRVSIAASNPTGSKSSPKLSTTQKTVTSTDMPAFADVIKHR